MKRLWIRVDANVAQDPKVHELSDRLDISIPTCVGLLVGVWGQVAAHNCDGDLTGISARSLAIWAGYEGTPKTFADAFFAIFTEEKQINGWTDHQGKLIELNARDAARKAHQRKQVEASTEKYAQRPESNETVAKSHEINDLQNVHGQSEKSPCTRNATLQDITLPIALTATTKATTSALRTVSNSEVVTDIADISEVAGVVPGKAQLVYVADKADVKAEIKTEIKTERTTWMTPYFNAWVDKYSSKPNAGLLAKALKAVHDEVGPEVLLPQFEAYLADTEAKFISLPKFASTHGAYATKRKTDELDVWAAAKKTDDLLKTPESDAFYASLLDDEDDNEDDNNEGDSQASGRAA